MGDYSVCCAVKDFRDRWVCRTGFKTFEEADKASNQFYMDVYNEEQRRRPGIVPRIHTQLIPHYTPLGKYFLPLTLKYENLPSVWYDNKK